MALGFGIPGAYASPESRYVQLLQSMPNSNNGTMAGGLGSVLQKALMGLMMGREADNQKAAQGVTSQALQALSGTPASTIQFNAPRPDGTGSMTQDVPAVAPNRNLAMTLLASNPETAPLATQMAFSDADYARSRADALADTKAARQFQADQAKTKMDFLTGQEAQKEKFEAGQNALKLKSAADIAAMKTGAMGKYYAVPTGAGVMLLDKGTGMAVMLGKGPDGSPVQIGSPFKPLMTPDGVPTAIPSTPAGTPAVSNPGGPSDSSVTPLMPPSVDASAQGAVAEAKTRGQNTAKKEFQASPAYSVYQANAATLDRLADTAKELKASPGLDANFGLESYVPNMPGGAAADASAKMQELKSQIAQNVLQMYRQMSQTGGAVGQVSNFEQEMFQNNLAALSQAQSPKQFREQLDKIINFVDASKARLQQAYERQYGGVKGAPQINAPATVNTQAANGIPAPPPGFVVHP